MASELRIAVVKRELEHHGWVLKRITDSHHIFVKEGESLLSIPVHNNKVKTCYGSKIKKACNKGW